MIPRRKARFYKGEWRDILKLFFSGKVSNGNYISEFENKFAKYIGVDNAVAVSSGRAVINILLDIFNLSKGDEIILPSDSLKDFIFMIKEKGFIPRLVDIEKNSFNINPNLIKEKITDKTKLIILSHRYGLPADIDRIKSIAREYDINIIENCVHALGAEYKGRKVGSYGDAGFYVFEVAKPINTFGGAIMVTDSRKLAEKFRKKTQYYNYNFKKLVSKIMITCIEELIIRSPLYKLISKLFIYRKSAALLTRTAIETHSRIRQKYFRFSNLQALLGLKQLKELDKRNKRRRKIARNIIGQIRSNIDFQKSEFKNKRIFHFLVGLLKWDIDVTEIRKKLITRGIDAGIKEEFLEETCGRVENERGYPIMKELYKNGIQLPLYDNMNDSEINKVVKTINKL